MLDYLHTALSLYQHDSVLSVGQAQVFPGGRACNSNVTVLPGANATAPVACAAPKLLPKGVQATWPPK